MARTNQAAAAVQYAPRSLTVSRHFPKTLTAIRRHCVSCMGGNAREVAKCPCTDCHLWPFRFAMSPRKAIRKGLLPCPVGNGH
ncbi:MAG: hypothetical protein HPY69_14955 [Armatimonadetes bacterium]|nr:hypothetical protein [Armatimonadota bacterium]